MKFDPPDEFRFGATQVLPWLWLGGEEDVDEPLQDVDIWIDFRDDNPWNRRIETPNNVVVIRLPFSDGDGNKAESIFPLAKSIVDRVKVENKKVLLSCHAGVSRSATLALWIMAEEMGFESAWCNLKLMRPHVEPHENFFGFVNKIKHKTKKNHDFIGK